MVTDYKKVVESDTAFSAADLIGFRDSGDILLNH